MPITLTDHEKKLMAEYEFDEADIRAIRRTVAALESKDERDRQRLEELAAQEAANNKKKEGKEIEIL